MPNDHTTDSLVLGGGCFWCVEAAYQQLRGVTEVTSGYAGGHWPDPTYERVCSGTTGHAQVARVEYDPEKISLEDILRVFWVVHNPTTRNRQGYDIGTQYRSIILYADETQKTAAEKSRDEAQNLWDEPIVTEIVPLEKFYEAEPYHQNYFARQPQAAYCQAVINPKLAKLREHYAALLR